MPTEGPDGVLYPSRFAAAQACGVTESLVHYHLRKYGNLNLLGSQRMPCEWRGKRYESVAAVAYAAGTSDSTVRWHLQTHGNLDRLANGSGGHNNRGGKPKKTAIGGRVWPSQRAAARALRVDKATIARWLKNPRHYQECMFLAVQEYAQRGAKTPEKESGDGR